MRCCIGSLAAAVLLIVTLSGFAADGAPRAADALADGFVRPPAAARPWVYWFWMDGNLSREGITADLEAMHRVGIGGVIIMEVNVGIPRGPVEFMSEVWRGLFRHVVSEASRLGLEVTLNAGPGWTGSGGPWVRPEQSMQQLVAGEMQLEGPQRFTGSLPRGETKADFYRDVAVLAFPTPAVDRRIADIREKALYERQPFSSQPHVKPFLPAPADYPSLPPGATIPRKSLLELTPQLDADGLLTWDVPPGNWTILRLGRTSTGANTRPAPAPGLGLECDKLDKVALEAHFDAFVGRLLDELGPRAPSAGAGWTTLHIDSWEMGAQNWTAALRDEFRTRRGYDLLPYLPVFTGRVVENLEVSERFLWDLRQTVQELILENHASHLKTLGRRHGFQLSIEPYDMTPCADMSLGGVADTPMCEFWLYGFDTSYSVFEAASVAHTRGRPVVAAEAFTSTAAERWQAYPGSMKALGDWALCAGVNRLVFHRYQHQPWLALRPGMTMGPYGVHYERTQTWWDFAPAYHQYLARCQFLLRQGLPVADICYLTAEGAPHVFRPPASATQGRPPDRRGYNFDGCTAETLQQRLSVDQGRLVLPDGMSYAVLVLPEWETMTRGLLEKIAQLVAEGATVIGPPPRKSPSLSERATGDAQVQALAGRLWGDCDGRQVTENRYGAGRVVWLRGDEEPDPADEAHPLEGARWIWQELPDPARAAPVGRCYFRRAVTLAADSPVEKARLFLTADNAFEAWVNGRPAGSGDNFHETYALDVTSLVQPGHNVLAVQADNGGETPNPAGLIGVLRIGYRDGRTQEVVTDGQWQASDSSSGSWRDDAEPAGGWPAARELGPLGMAPWSRVGSAQPMPTAYGEYGVTAGVLRAMGVVPDFESDAPLRYTHRRVGETDLYFVANPRDELLAAEGRFRVTGRQAELWDPVTGRQRELFDFTIRGAQTAIPLRLHAHQSVFVVFRHAVRQQRAGAGNDAEPARLAELAGPWEVSFDPSLGGPPRVVFDRLEDWTTRQEEGIRYYSGPATYRCTFDLPWVESRAGTPLSLDLGLVHHLARVRLNERDLGVVWCAPWQVDVSGVVAAEGNRLEITVVNLWPNRLIGDERFPADCQYDRSGRLVRWPVWLLENKPRPVSERVTFTTWKHYDRNAPLLPSGLLGPVQILGRGPAPGEGARH